MSRQVREAKKFVRGRRFLTAALIMIVAVGLGVTAGRGGFTAAAAPVTPPNGDALCGYSGTSQFTESTVVRWAQVNGQGSGATFIAYANDENSTLLGVNTATPMGTTDATHAAHASPGNGGSTTQHDALGRPYYPALYITNTTLHPLSGGQGVGDWQQGGLVRNINGSGTPFVDDVFGTWVVGSQSINPSAAPGLLGTLTSGPLSTTVNTTSLGVTTLTKAVTTGDAITVATTGHTFAFVAASPGAPVGATTIPVTSKKSNFAFPNGSTITGTTAQTGNYARQATLPTKNDWNLGTGSDNPVGTTFAAMGDEGYGTEFRWNVSNLKDSDGNALTAGNVYKIQMIEHDGDQNKGGDSGEFCASVQFPGISTTATGGAIQADGTATVSDSATVSGVQKPLPSGANKVTFSVYGPDPTPGGITSDDCSGTPQTRDVALNSTTPNQAYPSGDFTVNAPGDYHFTANLTVGGSVTASSACDATGETATVTSRPTSLTTNAGGPYAPPSSLSDTATLSGGTSNAGGTLTFTLYADDGSGGCGTVLGTDSQTVSGANGVQYTGTVNAPTVPGYFVPGTYHWSVSYGGDPSTGNDASSDGVTPCPATDATGPPVNHENPVVLSPSINIDKSPKNQTIESGGTATWTITVTNNGTAPLTSVVINDSNSTSLAPDCNRTAAQTLVKIQAVGNHDSTFDPTESFNYTCSLAGLTGTSFHNVIDVTATSGAKTDVTDEDTADVLILNPSIDVLKTPPNQSVPVGGTAHFNIAVTNDGDTGLTNVVVNDPAVTGAGTNDCALTAAQTLPKIQAVGNHDSTFDVGETFNYDCTSGPVTAAFLNVAQACGDDSLSTTVCDTSDNGGSPPTGCPEASRCGQVDIESLSTAQDFKPQDAATLSGFSNTPNGSVTFSLYKDPAGMKTCDPLDLIYADTVSISGTGHASTASASLLSALNQVAFGNSNTAGNYNWQVTYGGDTHGNAGVPATAANCGTENFQVDNG